MSFPQFGLLGTVASLAVGRRDVAVMSLTANPAAPVSIQPARESPITVAPGATAIEEYACEGSN
jgi:hypothetical protein